MKRTTTRRSAGWITGLALVLAAGAGAAQDSASCGDTYDGKTVTLMTSFSPGGGGDQLARLHGEMLGKHLPGSPSVTVENRPGGAHGVGANYFDQRTEPDGMTVFYTNSNILRTFVSGGDAIVYDPRDFRAIGGLKVGNQVLVVRSEVKANIDDPSADPVIVGDTNGIRAQVPLTIIAADYLGHNYKWNIGYEGGDDLVLALMRGEIDVYGSINRGDLRSLIEQGAAVPLLQDGDVRADDFPDTPTLKEMLEERGVELSPDDAAAYNNWLAPERAQHLFFAPGGTPEDVLSCLRNTYVTITNDPVFDERLSAVVGDAWSLVPPAEAEELVVQASTVDDALTAHLAEIRRAHGLPTD